MRGPVGSAGRRCHVAHLVSAHERCVNACIDERLLDDPAAAVAADVAEKYRVSASSCALQGQLALEAATYSGCDVGTLSAWQRLPAGRRDGQAVLREAASSLAP